MRKKEEFESARLMDFEFRQRARATRLLARHLGVDEQELVSEIAFRTEDGVLDLIAAQTPDSKGAVANAYVGVSARLGSN